MNTYLIIAVLALIGTAAFFNRSSKKTETLENKTFQPNSENRQQNRVLKLVVLYDFAQTSKIISEKATEELIEKTMKSIDWEQFHAVYLEDKNGNMMDVSGSLHEDGLASSYVNDDIHLLKVNPPETVEEMTEILVDFLKGEGFWRNKYKYE